LAAPWEAESATPESWREVIYDDPQKPVSARILWRPSLHAGFEVTGPAVIEEPNSTTLVFPGDRARISAHGHIIIDIDLPQGVLA
jgi:N-methylhydantoinase A